MACVLTRHLFSSYHSLLFATTNHIERLDPALSRPGRMDVWVNFTHATKWQAEGIFKCFFPYQPSSASGTSTPTKDKDASVKNLPLPKRKSHAIPLLTEEEINELAKRFAEAIPEDELSVSISRCGGVETMYHSPSMITLGCWTSRVSS